jgi:hypothetical protein
MTVNIDTVTELDQARRIAKLNNAYTSSRVLHSAVEVGLFALLANGSADAPSICDQLHLHPRLAGDFLDALVGLGLLERDGTVYSNSALAEHYLVPGAGHFLGGGVARNAVHNYAMWGRLTEALRDGRQKPSGVADAVGFEPIYQSTEETRRFLAHMDANNSFVGGHLSEVLDWSGYSSFVDVGGARGNVSVQILREQPHLQGGVFDLPGLKQHFDEHMELNGTTGKVTFHPGDFFNDSLPETDVILFGHVLHDWSPEIRQMLIKKAFAAVRPGGALVVYDQMIDDDRRDAQSLLISLNVRLVREGGSEYSAKEISGWATDAGFTVEAIIPIESLHNDKVLVARKPA